MFCKIYLRLRQWKQFTELKRIAFLIKSACFRNAAWSAATVTCERRQKPLEIDECCIAYNFTALRAEQYNADDVVEWETSWLATAVFRELD